MLKKKLKTSIFGNQKTFSLQIKLNKNSNSIILTENYQIIREDDKIFCKVFNTYFTNVTEGLNLQQVNKT